MKKMNLLSYLLMFALVALFNGCAQLPKVEEDNAISKNDIEQEGKKGELKDISDIPKKINKSNPIVVIKTSKGDITLELDSEKAPITVANFLKYIKEGHYKNTIFHRVMNNFMIQGGGFDIDFNQKATKTPIKNEATNGLKNTRGTIAMARTGAPHSAKAQFFINVTNNHFLNNKDSSRRGYGYCVFGKVIDGMDVVDKIKIVKTGTHSGHRNVPNDKIIIYDIESR